MKYIFIFLLLLPMTTLISQSNTEVYLFDITSKEGVLKLSNSKNISNNLGYDNQPYFYDENTILFSSTRNNQTDIASYNIKNNQKNWITNTSNGSEYSPIKIPGSKNISAIRLDNDGTQLLYSHDYNTGISTALCKDLVIGYHIWHTKDILIAAVLQDQGLSLSLSNLKEKSNTTIAKNIGRSLHKIPETELISYISKEKKEWEIKSLDPISGVVTKIINTLPNSEDMCWLSDGTILMPKGQYIYTYNPKTDKNWSILYSSLDNTINTITRMATNKAGNKLALVAEVSPEHIVQKQLDAYNARDIEAFMATFTEDITIYDYPNTIRTESKEAMRPGYENKFKDEPNLFCEIKHRIVIGNKVIDEEYVRYSYGYVSVVAIYEVENGKIAKVTFIKPTENQNNNTIAPVEKQLIAYNAREIDAFVNCFSDTIKVFNFPHTFSYQGQDIMHKRYASFFANTPDLHCEINNRIHIGNKIIDEEYLTTNGRNWKAVAIYEINDNKISKVTFIK